MDLAVDMLHKLALPQNLPIRLMLGLKLGFFGSGNWWLAVVQYCIIL